ncbi:prophage LambdaSa2, site-specific recombinase phage integrase family protein [Streptococcus varani]|uniref:Prophage LambdaSa2, site-specific recombinase phage integrase family protein n=1 Tax=Streptococcus varani TaxID=1608583 RepID=A0A0E4H4W9_9STRE|nr:tyrosine-type recombinase/integrase [Streptococcus varani]CQR24590.1 prophage LambdaSa2, site-specific recombinase phage integrase family protein [Streptococcus varani]
MGTVEPIRNRKDVEMLIQYVFEESPHREEVRNRNGTILLIGFNTGFRVGDIVKLQKKHIRGWHIEFYDQKTGKHTRRKMTRKLKTHLLSYTEGMRPEDFLFPSRECRGKGSSKKRHKHIHRDTVYKFLKADADALGLENIATHSMRKTFGMMIYEQQKDVAIVMDLLNHASQSYTVRYIGKNQDSQDKAIAKFEGF